MFGRRNRAKMESRVSGRVRSVRMLNNKASRQHVTDKLTQKTDKPMNCSKGCSSKMQSKSSSHARATKMNTTDSAKK